MPLPPAAPPESVCPPSDRQVPQSIVDIHAEIPRRGRSGSIGFPSTRSRSRSTHVREQVTRREALADHHRTTPSPLGESHRPCQVRIELIGSWRATADSSRAVHSTYRQLRGTSGPTAVNPPRRTVTPERVVCHGRRVRLGGWSSGASEVPVPCHPHPTYRLQARRRTGPRRLASSRTQDLARSAGDWPGTVVRPEQCPGPRAGVSAAGATSAEHERDSTHRNEGHRVAWNRRRASRIGRDVVPGRRTRVDAGIGLTRIRRPGIRHPGAGSAHASDHLSHDAARAGSAPAVIDRARARADEGAAELPVAEVSRRTPAGDRPIGEAADCTRRAVAVVDGARVRAGQRRARLASAHVSQDCARTRRPRSRSSAPHRIAASVAVGAWTRADERAAEVTIADISAGHSQTTDSLVVEHSTSRCIRHCSRRTVRQRPHPHQ